jgi:hypothetical protein
MPGKRWKVTVSGVLTIQEDNGCSTHAEALEAAYKMVLEKAEDCALDIEVHEQPAPRRKPD